MDSMDPRYEFDAPTMYDPEELARAGVPDDGADAWFDHSSFQQDEYGSTSASSSASEQEEEEEEDTVPEEEEEEENEFGGSIAAAAAASAAGDSELREEIKRQAAALDQFDEFDADPSPEDAYATDYSAGEGTDASFNVVEQHAASGMESEGEISNASQYERPLTMPRSPKFRADARAAERAQRIAEAQERAADAANAQHLRQSSSSRSSSRAAAVPQFKPRSLTIPKTPKFKTVERQAYRPTQHAETEVERTLREFEEKRAERLQRRARLDAFRKRTATAPAAQREIESTKPLTMPEEFEFRTRTRAALHPEPEAEAEAEAASERRQRNFDEFRDANGLTQPAEFMLRTSQRTTHAHDSEEPAPFVSEAERLRRFHERSLRSDEDAQKFAAAGDYFNRSLTIPRAPKFATDDMAHRSSLRATEDEILQEMAEKQFKARPVDKRVLESDGFAGLKKVIKRKPTQPEEFHFRSAQRPQRSTHEVAALRAEDMAATRRAAEHKAALRNMAKEAPRAPTMPQSPALLTRKRSRADETEALVAELESEAKRARQFRAQPIYRPRPKSQTMVAPKELTIPEEFRLSTELRGQAHREQLESQLAQTLAEEEMARSFKANPIRHYTTVSRGPEIAPRELTVPQEFPLATTVRGDQYQDQFAVFLDEEREHEAQAHEFRARPFVEKRFVPKALEPKPLTAVEDVTLNSSNRAEQRLVFEQSMKIKEAKEAEIAHQRAIEEAERAARELKAYRRALVHKARPAPEHILYQAPKVAKRPPAKLTAAQSPRFATNSRFGRRRAIR